MQHITSKGVQHAVEAMQQGAKCYLNCGCGGWGGDNLILAVQEDEPAGDFGMADRAWTVTIQNEEGEVSDFPIITEFGWNVIGGGITVYPANGEPYRVPEL